MSCQQAWEISQVPQPCSLLYLITQACPNTSTLSTENLTFTSFFLKNVVFIIWCFFLPASWHDMYCTAAYLKRWNPGKKFIINCMLFIENILTSPSERLAHDTCQVSESCPSESRWMYPEYASAHSTFIPERQYVWRNHIFHPSVVRVCCNWSYDFRITTLQVANLLFLALRRIPTKTGCPKIRKGNDKKHLRNIRNKEV